MVRRMAAGDRYTARRRGRVHHRVMVVTAAVRVVRRGGRSGRGTTAGRRVIIGRRGRCCCGCGCCGGSRRSGRGFAGPGATAVMTVRVVL